MSRGRRMGFAGILAVLVLALSACTGLPTSGPVMPGLDADTVPRIPDIEFHPSAPKVDGTPEEIVRGFIEAATRPNENWASARLFLAPEAAGWDPTSGVIVDDPGERAFVTRGDTVEMTLNSVATLDNGGGYSVADPGKTTLGYALAQYDGQWRITRVPDGVVIGSDAFSLVYRAYELMFYDPTWSFLIPDVRWYPQNNVVTRIAAAVVDGTPSPWLDPAVVSAFPEDVGLRWHSVTVAEGIAKVDLTAEALGLESVTIGRMRAQLEASLASAGVKGVDLIADGAALDATPATIRTTAIDPRPLVRTEAGIGYLDVGTVVPVDTGTGENIADLPAAAIALGRGGLNAAVQQEGGEVLRVDEDEIRIVDPREGLIPPSIDPLGWVWSVPRESPGELLVAGEFGSPVPLPEAWPGATRISAMQVSRDGTRIVGAVTFQGESWLMVSGVVRESDGTPVRLTDPERLVRLSGGVKSLDWQDDRTVVAVVGSGEGSRMLEQPIGGVARWSDLVIPGAEDIGAGGSSVSAHLRTEGGALYARRGTVWQEAAEGVLTLGTQAGR